MSEAFTVKSTASTASMSTDSYGSTSTITPQGELSSSSPSRKKIHFNPKVYVRYTLHINNYSRAETAATWINANDLIRTRTEIQQALEEIQLGEREMERGLEYRTRAASTRRKAVKNEAKAAVLDEQALQDDPYTENDAEYIACLYTEAGRDSVDQAAMRGLLDEHVANRLYSNDARSICSDDDDSKDHEHLSAAFTALAHAAQEHDRQTRASTEQKPTSKSKSRPPRSNSAMGSTGRRRRLSSLKFRPSSSGQVQSPRWARKAARSKHDSIGDGEASVASASSVGTSYSEDSQGGNGSTKWTIGPLRMLLGKAA